MPLLPSEVSLQALPGNWVESEGALSGLILFLPGLDLGLHWGLSYICFSLHHIAAPGPPCQALVVAAPWHCPRWLRCCLTLSLGPAGGI